MTFKEFEALAKPAFPIDDDDWGSDRQVEAENAFFEAVRAELPQLFSDEFEHWCLKATSEEMIDETLSLIRLVKED